MRLYVADDSKIAAREENQLANDVDESVTPGAGEIFNGEMGCEIGKKGEGMCGRGGLSMWLSSLRTDESRAKEMLSLINRRFSWMPSESSISNPAYRRAACLHRYRAPQQSLQ